MLVARSFQRRRTQPQRFERFYGSLAEGLLHSFDGKNTVLNGKQFAQTLSGLGGNTAPLLHAGHGLGYKTGAATETSISVTADGPLLSTDPWAFAFTHKPTANVSLSHAFGFNLSAGSGTINSGVFGTHRGCLNYLNDYYFWGGNADWDTGIAWDTDGGLHTVMFTHDGTNLWFWRDGVLRAKTTRPAGLYNSSAGGNVVIGARHTSAAGSPASTFLAARIWSRHITSTEAAAYTANPWCVYEPTRQQIVLAAAAAGTYTLSNATYAPGSITATGVTPRVSVAVT